MWGPEARKEVKVIFTVTRTRRLCFQTTSVCADGAETRRHGVVVSGGPLAGSVGTRPASAFLPPPLGDVRRAGSASTQRAPRAADSVLTLACGNEGDLLDPGGPRRSAEAREPPKPPPAFPRALSAAPQRGPHAPPP